MNKWTTEIDNITQSIEESFGNLNSDKMNWNPNDETWSIGQNIDHLIVINETYFPVIKSAKSGTYKLPFMAKFGFMVSFLGNTILKSVQPERKKKTKTFPIWEPTQSQIPADILYKFRVHQEELKKLIETSHDLIDDGAIISSPANRNIVYKLETAFDIIVAHERRHFKQATEILQQLMN